MNPPSASPTPPDHPAHLHPSPPPPPRVQVIGPSSFRRLVAAHAIAAGESVLELEGLPTATPTRYSLQIDTHLHLDADPTCPEAFLPLRFPWRFMNHSCAPSAAIRGRTVYALQNLAPGDEVTFNYNSTEHSMAEPFLCRCGAPHCNGWIRGYAHLTPSQKHALSPHLAQHLRTP